MGLKRVVEFAAGDVHIEIDSNLEQLGRELKALSEKRMTRAIVSSVNKAASKAKTTAKREIAAARNVPVKPVAKQLVVIKATSGRLKASLWARGRPISLMKLRKKPKQGPRGVTATIEQGEGPRLFRGHFIATMRNTGRSGVFYRTVRTAKYRGKLRQPIKQRNLPSVASTMVRDDIAAKIRKTYNESFIENVNHEITRQIEIVRNRINR